MNRYEMYTKQGHLCLTENNSSFYSDDIAIKVFNNLLKKELKGNINLKTKDNEIDKYIETDNLIIEFKDYINIMNTINKMKKKEIDTKKKIVIGTATTIAISSLAVGILTAASPKEEIEELKGTLIMKQVDEELSEEESKKVLDQEIITDISYPVENNYTYSEEPFIVEEKEEDIDTVYVDVDSNYDEKLESNVSNYDEVINKVSEKWGVSNDLIRDIMKQESHGGTITNKMQIVFDAWKDQVIKTYNFEDNRYETIVLTDNPENYPNVSQRISREELDNPNINISVGTIMLAYTYKQCDYNLSATIQAYNFGVGATKQLQEKAALETGINYEDIRNDETNLSFMDYTDIKPSSYGDHNYVYKIYAMSSENFNLDDGKTYTMKYLDEFGNVVEKKTQVKSAYNKATKL